VTYLIGERRLSGQRASAEAPGLLRFHCRKSTGIKIRRSPRSGEHDERPLVGRLGIRGELGAAYTCAGGGTSFGRRKLRADRQARAVGVALISPTQSGSCAGRDRRRWECDHPGDSSAQTPRPPGRRAWRLSFTGISARRPLSLLF
jgi:hypothetical protein